jgi:hypothetical protein
MKRYGNNQPKLQTVGEYLKKTQDRSYAFDQIDKHNQKSDVTKLKLKGDMIYQRHGNGYTPVNISYSSSTELNSVNAIREVNSGFRVSLAPSLAQQLKQIKEKDILQSLKNLKPELFYSQQGFNLKGQLLEYKEEAADELQEQTVNVRDFRFIEQYQKIINKERSEIDWIRKNVANSYYNFFNSEYARSFGFIVDNDEAKSNSPVRPDNQANSQNPDDPDEPDQGVEEGKREGNSRSNNPNNQNQKAGQQNSSNQSNSNPDEEEKMLEELMSQLKLMKQELENKDKALEDKDRALKDESQKLLEEKNKTNDLSEKLASEKILTKELTDKNEDLTGQVKSLTVKVSDLTKELDLSEGKNVDLQNKFEESQAKVRPLEEKVLDLKHYNKQLEDDKIDLRETQKDMREVQKILIEDKKNLTSEKKMLEDKAQLLSIDKNHFKDLSLEQAIKITQLEQIHCNDPDHFEIIQSGQVNYTD